MTIRNLDRAFAPGSIALIGGGRRPGSLGAVLAQNLFNAGFDGPIMPVHPQERAIQGVLAYPRVEDLPLAPDLAVIATPPDTVPGLVAELGARGTKAVVVITAGFAELGEDGRALQQRVLDAARPHLLRVFGPNCLGVMVPGRGVNASFAHLQPKKGDLAFVSQSGAMLTAVLDWATCRGIGFSHLVSLGAMADVDFGDLLDYLGRDPGTRAILLYAEAITHARKFMSAARAAARTKPVVVIKAGRTEQAARAATSHTGALAGSDVVYDAAFRRAGMLRVGDLDELFDAVETLSVNRGLSGDRLAILSNGGGIGVLATDSLIDRGGHLAELEPTTIEALDQVLPRTWSHGNPVDIIGDAPPKRYADALTALLRDRNADAVLVLNCPTAVGDSAGAARAVVEAIGDGRRPVLTTWVGDGAAAEARRLFAERRIPTYETPNKAISGFMDLVNYRRNQELLMQVPPSVPEEFEPDTEAARAIVERALAENRAWLSEPEAKDVLAAYGVPVVKTLAVKTRDEAAAAAAELGRPVALKILSPDITHKSDVGGVMLNLNGPNAVRDAACAMLASVRQHRPDARIDGLSVQEMADIPDAVELIVGATDDVLFGPVVLFGHGGTAVEVMRDQALALPPLNPLLAREMMSRTRVWNLLQGYRNRPPAAIDQIALTLVKVAQLVIDIDAVAELDINPLFAGPTGVLALDARVAVARPRLRGTRRLAIRPYPKELEKEIAIPDGCRFLLRPIRPEDAPRLHDMIQRTDPEDIRLRFFAPLKALSPALCARLTQIDYDREMALVAVSLDEPEPAYCGVVRLMADPDNQRAEYAVLLRSDLKGRGLGYLLMREILAHAERRGVREVFGEVLRENRNMLRLCEELGFRREPSPSDPDIVEVRYDVRPGLAA
ncbi:MAG TPA: bifunctional acetate--CoA ligase family protein/GNAT family N-acetyltransferase [Geminicoccaceae bacterium]|nr:bifunctional acetate--CoA ligase family protein/GNAT family N-acetyltransferase [Geminicoccaceae bacterium]